jgi:tetratricopeptide (TPR) repeat protein
MAEKPLINEKFESNSSVVSWDWDFPKSRHGKDAKKAKAKDAASAGPESGESKLKKGMRLFLTKRWGKALEEFLSVQPEGFDNNERAELAYYLGLCYTKLERFDDAMLYFEQVITIADDSMRTYQCRMILAYIYIVTGRAEMAETELKRLQDGGRESAMMYNTLAYAAYAQKRFIAAVEYYEKALDIDNENLTAINGLGYVLADTGLDKLKGLRLCRKAVDRNPENAAYLDSLGWAAFQCGKLDEARKWLRQAMELAPHEKEIVRHFRLAGGGAA